MQSYASPETQATFCEADEANVFGPTMENHQKNRAGNQIVLDYVSRRYRFPRDQEALIYLSQLNQAHCMQVGVEHFRRSMPRCMGAIYWQLNDCWPVASWSSIEFTGRWKALHHAARRFYAPALVSALVPGDETTINGNYRRSTVRRVHIYTVCDAPELVRGELRWTLYHLDGRRLRSGEKTVVLKPRQSRRELTLDLAREIAEYGRDAIYLRIALIVKGAVLSEESVLLSPPRFLALPKARTEVRIERLSARQARLGFRSDAFQHRFAFDLAGIKHAASDNYFDLYPGDEKIVQIEFARPVSRTKSRATLRHRSLVDTY
jgi:beta-mannosidase